MAHTQVTFEDTTVVSDPGNTLPHTETTASHAKTKLSIQRHVLYKHT